MCYVMINVCNFSHKFFITIVLSLSLWSSDLDDDIEADNADETGSEGGVLTLETL